MKVSVNNLFDSPCLIVNPHSNQGKALQSLEAILPELKANWPNIRVFHTKTIGHATQITREQIVAGASVILVMGGDGTLNEVVNALGENSKVPLGILPSGSGNDTAKSFSWSEDIKGQVRRLMNAQVKMVDLGLVISKTQKRYFLNVASCGISAVIAKNMREQERKTGAPLWYYLQTLKAIWSYRPTQIRVNIDGKNIQHPDCSLLAFANGQYFGGGMQIAPGARMDDGRFDEIAVSKMGLGFFLRHGLSVYRGKHLDLPQVYKMRGQVALVESLSKQPVYVEADGEDAGELPARFEIFSRCLPVLI
ncbi:MAG: diacylglycerol kinase family protein [Myxococcaceae bacterium]